MSIKWFTKNIKYSNKYVIKDVLNRNEYSIKCVLKPVLNL